ncbi:unnamed protein product, partial [Ectocarpus sp. 8 AP-2014]
KRGTPRASTTLVASKANTLSKSGWVKSGCYSAARVGSNRYFSAWTTPQPAHLRQPNFESHDLVDTTVGQVSKPPDLHAGCDSTFRLLSGDLACQQQSDRNFSICTHPS